MMYYELPIHKNIIYNEIEIKSLLISKLWKIGKAIAQALGPVTSYLV